MANKKQFKSLLEEWGSELEEQDKKEWQEHLDKCVSDDAKAWVNFCRDAQELHGMMYMFFVKYGIDLELKVKNPEKMQKPITHWAISKHLHDKNEK